MQLQVIQNKIYEIRGHKVMLDFDLAMLYEVETKVLNQAVKRNMERFPEKFMFQLSKEEWENLRSQFVTSKSNHGGMRYLPFAFTEHGVTMLASVLRSKRAIKMNIALVEAFIALKEFALNYKELSYQIKELQNTVGNHDKHLNELYRALELLLQDKETQQKEQENWKNRKRIGYKNNNK
jgi:phage regulator Rha-like protein